MELIYLERGIKEVPGALEKLLEMNPELKGKMNIKSDGNK